jgi:sucrose phosphorylase
VCRVLDGLDMAGFGQDQVQLIAYADRLGGSLPGLARLLDGPLGGLFGGVHVLPFFLPYDGADAGFDPVDHLRVDPRLGDWDDLHGLGRSTNTVVDLIVNHISADSAPFQDFVERGDASPLAGMFLTFNAVFPDGATEADLLRIVRPRPGLPFTPMTVRGRRRLMWTTFTSRQVDLDVHHRESRRYLTRILERLAGCEVSMVRLDAVGYAVKAAGTSCFMTAETDAFIVELTDHARRLGLQVLTEVHAHYRYAVEIAGRVDRVYDFALPPLILHALFTGDNRPLHEWLTARPTNAVTVLETHDGIGMVDVGAGQTERGPGLLLAEQVDALVARIHRNSGGTSRATTARVGAAGVIYQVNCTLYDALGRDDRRYLLARALQFFAPGIPQVYYVGLLAGGNDMDLLARTGEGREVNRHRYSDSEVSKAVEQPVVRALMRLIRFRNVHPAFAGEFSVLAAPAGEVALRWRAGTAEAMLSARLVEASYRLTFTADGSAQTVTDAADLPF